MKLDIMAPPHCILRLIFHDFRRRVTQPQPAFHLFESPVFRHFEHNGEFRTVFITDIEDAVSRLNDVPYYIACTIAEYFVVKTQYKVYQLDNSLIPASRRPLLAEARSAYGRQLKGVLYRLFASVMGLLVIMA